MLEKIKVGYKLKDFSAMLGGRKRNSYVIHVWSDKSLGKGFSGKYFVYMAYVRGAPAETFN